MKKIFLFLSVLALGFLIFLFSLILIFNYSSFNGAKVVGERIRSKEVISLTGKTFFISDLHIKCTEDLGLSLDAENIVIVGDLFDSELGFFNLGKNNEDRFRTVTQGLVKENSDAVNIYYVSASKFHDAFIGELAGEFEKDFGSTKFYSIGKEAKFSVDGIPVAVLHGDQFNNTGVIPCAVSYFSGLILRDPLLVEKIFKISSGIDKNTWFVNGHSHVPALDLKNKLANCGSKTGVPFFGSLLGIKTRTGILFEGGRVEIMEY